MDGKVWCPGDEEIAAALRTAKAPVIVAVNKTDDKRARGRSVEFYRLGFEPVVEIAAEHGEGTGDLLDEVISRLPTRRERRGDARRKPSPSPSPSSDGQMSASRRLLNRILREERSIVSDMPGTTRDTVDAMLTWHRRNFRIVDTAGIRRPGRVARSGQLEAVSVIVARRAIEQADVAVLMIDSTEGATDQDGAIAGEAEKAGCGIIIVANKWDLMKGRGADFSKTFDEELRRHLKFLEYAPILHISASTGERAGKVLETIDKVAEATNAENSDRRAQPLRASRDRGPPAREPRPPARPDPLRRADRHRAALVRVLHERRHGVSLLVRAVSGESTAGVVRLDGDADQDSSQEELNSHQSSVAAVAVSRDLTDDVRLDALLTYAAPNPSSDDDPQVPEGQTVRARSRTPS